jgi:hypothetical protein
MSALIEKQGLEQSLTVKLRNAKRDCERGHKTPACNKLGAFDNEVKAQTDKGITTAQADILPATATASSRCSNADSS